MSEGIIKQVSKKEGEEEEEEAEETETETETLPGPDLKSEG